MARTEGARRGPPVHAMPSLADQPTRVFLCDDNVDLRLLLNYGIAEHADL